MVLSRLPEGLIAMTYGDLGDLGTKIGDVLARVFSDSRNLPSLLQNSLSVRIFPIGMEFSSRRAIKLVESVL